MPVMPQVSSPSVLAASPCLTPSHEILTPPLVATTNHPSRLSDAHLPLLIAGTAMSLSLRVVMPAGVHAAVTQVTVLVNMEAVQRRGIIIRKPSQVHHNGHVARLRLYTQHNLVLSNEKGFGDLTVAKANL